MASLDALNARRYRILLVEDDLEDSSVFRQLLAEARGNSWEIEYIGRLSAALQRLEAGNVDVVVLDLDLPDADGLDGLARLRAQASHVPVVVLTGLLDESLGVQAMREGAEDYLVKRQVTGERLSRALEYAIERKRTEEGLLRVLSLVTATLECTTDGILIVSPQKTIVRYNRRFASMWGLAGPVLGSPADNWIGRKVLDQLLDPGGFLEKMRTLHSHPLAEGRDMVEFADGRLFERRSLPHDVRGQGIGRVWNFHDLTEQRRTADVLRETLSRLRSLQEQRAKSA